MKFEYKKYFIQGGTRTRPVIAIEVINKASNKAIKYEVLIDSGSDICIFDKQIGELLGFTFGSHNQSGEVRGVTGEPQHVYHEPIDINVGGWPYAIDAYFMELADDSRYGVVGQQGFFDLFIVQFDLAKEEIELKRRNIGETDEKKVRGLLSKKGPKNVIAWQRRGRKDRKIL